MKIAALSGSLRKGSYNTMLVNAAAKHAPEGMSVQVVDISAIPLYNGDDDLPDSKPAAVLALADQLRAADGILISTPEYNCSVSGVIKNTIDWMSRVENQPFSNKPVGIIGASAGQFGTARAQYHLRQVLVCLNARVMPRPEYFLGAVSSKFAEDGTLQDEDSARFLAAFMQAFGKWTSAQLTV
jgi:chromate reductase